MGFKWLFKKTVEFSTVQFMVKFLDVGQMRQAYLVLIKGIYRTMFSKCNTEVNNIISKI